MIGSSVPDELALLQSLRPDPPAADADAVAAARHALLHEAVRRESAERRRRSRPKLLARPLSTALAVAVLTAGALVAETTAGPLTARAEAVVALHRAARAASGDADPAPRPDQFLYTRSRGVTSSTIGFASGGTDHSITYLQDQLYEAWLSVDGSKDGLVRNTALGTPNFLEPGDRAALAKAHYPARAVGDVEINPVAASENPGDDLNDPSYAYLRSLPTNPVVLYLLIAKHSVGHGQTLPQEMLTTVSDMLTFSVAPPALRAALFEVAAFIPGVSVVPDTADFGGHHGTAVALTTHGIRQEVIFDPATGELIGTREVAVTAEPGIPSGTVLDTDSETVTIVDRIPASARHGQP